MIVARTLPELRTACASLRARHGSLALVPTMGALHAGHLALVRAGLASGGATVVSIFVNPLQFAANEDLARYPRDDQADLDALEPTGCALVWMPDLATMYPPGDATTITVAGPAERWEGDARPGHFRGVATVCAKLFGQVRPDRAYFGQKDWQQLQVVRRMVADLLLSLDIVDIETVREPDGLAMSSRNRFLTPEQRETASLLPKVMSQALHGIGAGAATATVLDVANRTLADAGFAVDYLALVDSVTLAPLTAAARDARLIAAARLGSVRLIDNMAATRAG